MAGTEGGGTLGSEPTSRRQILKLGGAASLAAWVIPAVQVFSMSSASADTASGGQPSGGGVKPEVIPASNPQTAVLGTQVGQQTLPKTGGGAAVEAGLVGAGVLALGVATVVAGRGKSGGGVHARRGPDAS